MNRIKLAPRILLLFSLILFVALAGGAFLLRQLRLIGQLSLENAGEAEALAAALTQQQTTAVWGGLLFAVLLVGLGAAGAFSLIRSLKRPLAALEEGVTHMAQGRYLPPVPVAGADELAELAQALNASAASQVEQLQNLEHTTRQQMVQLESRALKLETSIEIGKQAAAILDLDQLMQQVAELIQQKYGYYYVGIYVLDRPDRLMLRASSGEKDETYQRSLSQKDDDLIFRVLTSQIHRLIDNIYVNPQEVVHRNTKPQTQSELVLPLSVGGTAVGVLDIQHTQISAFSEADLPLFRLLTDPIAIAIRNASLYRKESTRRHVAETLREIGQAVTQSLDLNTVLSLILDHLHQIVPFDRGSLLLQRVGEMEIVAARGFPNDFDLVNARIPLDNADEDDIYVKIHQTEKPLLIPNVAQYPRWVNVGNIKPPKSWLGVPLMQEGEVFGMLSLSRLNIAPFTDDDAFLTESFALQAAIAIRNAQIHGRIQRIKEQMEYEVANRTKALQSAYEQLEQLDRTKSRFIAIASHELRTPITVLKGYSQILLKDPVLRENEYYTKMLEGILSGSKRLHTIVDSMLDMAKIDGRSLTLYPEALSINELVQEIFGRLEEALTARSISVTISPAIPQLPLIEADYDGVQKILFHLINNAVKYTPDGGEITIDGRAWREAPQASWPEQGVEIIVNDTGIGIERDALNVIFNKFYQTGQVALHSSGDTKFKGGGPGLGLAIAHGFTTAHRGLIWAESEGMNEETFPGSSFHVVLPLTQPKPQVSQPEPNGLPEPVVESS